MSIAPLNAIILAAGIFIGSIIAYPIGHVVGQGVGESKAAVRAVQKTVELLKERDKIDDEISTLDASALCNNFGLSEDDRLECVRRVEASATEP